MYKLLNKKDLPNSEIELEVEVAWSEINKDFEKELDEYTKEVELPGFRKGKAPRDMVRQKIGEMKILQDASSNSIYRIYPQIVDSEKIEKIIADPIVSITKIAFGNPLVFKLRIPVEPEIKLPDYKNIAKEINPKKEKVEIIDKDVEAELENIKKIHAERTKTKADDIKFDDAFVKQFGDFKNVDDFKKKVRDLLKNEKENRASQKARIEIIEKIINESKFDVPQALIERELQMMLYRFEHEIAAAGMKLDDYLKQINKKFEDVLKEWKPEAEKRSKMHLILREIAKKEKITPDEEKINHEVEHIKESHKDIDPVKAKSYFEGIYTNEKVFEFLENIK